MLKPLILDIGSRNNWIDPINLSNPEKFNISWIYLILIVIWFLIFIMKRVLQV